MFQSEAIVISQNVGSSANTRFLSSFLQTVSDPLQSSNLSENVYSDIQAGG